MNFHREIKDRSYSFIPSLTTFDQTFGNYKENMANYGELYGVNYVGEVILTNTPHQMTDYPRFIPGQSAKTRFIVAFTVAKAVLFYSGLLRKSLLDP